MVESLHFGGRMKLPSNGCYITEEEEEQSNSTRDPLSNRED
jgi:hypothetical protein